MTLAANRKNLKTYARQLFGVEWTEAKQAELIRECLTGFVRDTTPVGHPYGHISHDHAAHITRIDKILGNHGCEGMLLDGQGNNLSSQCTERGVALDVHYSNTGDTYGLTIMYVNGKLKIGDWGSLVERLAA